MSLQTLKDVSETVLEPFGFWKSPCFVATILKETEEESHALLCSLGAGPFCYFVMASMKSLALYSRDNPSWSVKGKFLQIS
ncbi:hypothetical protein SRHO_G00232930 [Serrasalmus rhombeus]